MIYSRQLITEEPQRQEIPAGLRTKSPQAVEQQQSERSVTITKSRKTPFGSTRETVTLRAISEETGEVIETMEFTQYCWDSSALTIKKKAEFARHLESKGYKVKIEGGR